MQLVWQPPALVRGLGKTTTRVRLREGRSDPKTHVQERRAGQRSVFQAEGKVENVGSMPESGEPELVSAFGVLLRSISFS